MTKQKNYSAAQVKNPTSIQHIVWLQPGQVLVIRLKKENYPNPKVDLSNDFMEMLCFQETSDEFQYMVIQSDSTQEWAMYSSTHLCDIWIDSDNVCARLVIMQACHTPEKSDFVTTVNPDCSDLRLKPYNVLEVVLYDEEFREHDEWTWTWDAKCNIDVEMIGYQHVNINMWTRYYEFSGAEPPAYPYARCVRTKAQHNPWCRQHHYWFRFNQKMMGALDADLGLIHVGNLKFFGFPNRFFKSDGYKAERFLAICCRLDSSRSTKEKLANTLSLKPCGEIPPPQFHQVMPMGIVGGTRSKKNRIYGPRVKDIDLRLLDSKSIDEGCNTVLAIPPEEVMRVVREPDPNFRCSATLYGVCGRRNIPFTADDYSENYDWWE
jgi:hypothetical protein